MRALLVEDESELADLIAAALRGAGLAVDPVERLEDASAAVAAIEYDVIILDLGLPDGDGTTLLRDLRRRSNPVPILILTARDALEERVAGLDAGADDYVLKPFHMHELVARVKALLRRPAGALAVRLTVGNVAFDTAHRQVEVAQRPVPLPRRELALLEILMRGAGRVITKASIEEHLYSFGEEIGSNAVEVNVHRLRKKLTDAGATTRIHTLRGVGYMMDGSAA